MKRQLVNDYVFTNTSKPEVTWVCVCCTYLASPAWSDLILDGDAQTIGWGAVSVLTSYTTYTSGSTDDGYLRVPLPFTFSFLGTTYTDVYVGTNTYLTFGHGSSHFGSLGASDPPYPTIFIAGGDHSAQRIGYFTQSDNVFIRRVHTDVSACYSYQPTSSTHS